jgi:hypothetical protein
MGESMKERRRYWDYYLSIEDDLIASSRVVDFVRDNLCCYSIEFARLLLVACAELDMVFKELCELIDASKKVETISAYYGVVTGRFANFVDCERYVKRSNSLVLRPFEDWTTRNSPDWWTGYNKVKHKRKDYFYRANLSNVLNATAALQITLFHFYYLNEGETPHAGFAPADLPRLMVEWHPEEPEREHTMYMLRLI